MVKWIKEVRFIHSAKEKAALAEMEKALARESVGRVLAKWQPYAGFIYFHPLLDRLMEAGHLPASTAVIIGARKYQAA